MSITLTQTTNLVIHLQAPKERREALERLVAIFEQYETTWTDPRSEEIRDWIATVIDIGENGAIEFDNTFLERSREQIDELINGILVDQFIPQLRLRRPVYIQETGWICERLFFNAYVPRATERPLTAVPHEFVAAMLSWVQELGRPKNEIAIRGDEPDLDAEILSQCPLGRMTLTAYPAMIRSVLFNQRVATQVDEVRQATEALQALRVDIEQRTNEQIQQAEERARERHAQLNQRIAEMERQHKIDMDAMQSRLTELRERQENSDNNIINLQVRCEQNKFEMDNLRRALALQAQQIQALQSRKKRKKFLGLF